MKTALITGPTSGIGLELAHYFARDGYALILVARHEETLNTLAAEFQDRYSVKSHTIAVDLSKQGSVEKLVAQLKNETVDILVNNAGFGNYGAFIETDTMTDEDLLYLNMTALTLLTKALLPMICQGSGKILNVASVAAFVPGPFMNTYFASKAYVLSFSIALREEVAAQGVTVSCLCPGPTHTNFGQRAHFDNALSRRHVMNVKDVANVAYRGLLAGKAIIVPGWKNKLIVRLSGFIPKVWLAKLVRWASGY